MHRRSVAVVIMW